MGREGKGVVEWEFEIGEGEGEVGLWWPLGQGEAKLYDFTLEVIDPVRNSFLSVFLARSRN